MDMTVEAIRKIEDLVLKANAVVKVPGEPEHLFYFRAADGSVGTSPSVCDPMPRNHRADDLETFVRLAGEFKDSAKTLVLIGRDRVTAVLDGDRREIVFWPLNATPQWKAVTTGARTIATLPQREFIRFLRVDLAGCVDDGLVTLVRSLVFAASEGADRNVGKSTEAIATSIKRSCMAGGQEVPDEVVLRVAVYEEWAKAEAVQAVRCALDVDLSAGTLSLQALAGEVHAASLAVRLQIQEAIVERLPEAIVGLGAV